MGKRKEIEPSKEQVLAVLNEIGSWRDNAIASLILTLSVGYPAARDLADRLTNRMKTFTDLIDSNPNDASTRCICGQCAEVTLN